MDPNWIGRDRKSPETPAGLSSRGRSGPPPAADPVGVWQPSSPPSRSWWRLARRHGRRHRLAQHIRHSRSKRIGGRGHIISDAAID